MSPQIRHGKATVQYDTVVCFTRGKSGAANTKVLRAHQIVVVLCIDKHINSDLVVYS